MPLFEVNQKYLKFKSEHEIYRFIHDPKNRISIHIWQDKSKADQNLSEGITRFQLARDPNIIEWKNNRISFGRVDTGDNPFGIKRSAIMMMSDIKNDTFLKDLISILDENPNIPGLDYISGLLKKELT